MCDRAAKYRETGIAVIAGNFAAKRSIAETPRVQTRSARMRVQHGEQSPAITPVDYLSRGVANYHHGGGLAHEAARCAIAADAVAGGATVPERRRRGRWSAVQRKAATTFTPV
jgi:hypothetical protein